MCNLLLYFILGISSFAILCYLYVTHRYNYWGKRKVPYIKPKFPFGNFGDVIMGRKSLIDLTVEQYRMFEGEKFFGTFDFITPVLVLRDPSLIEQILITEFQSFCNNRFNSETMRDELFRYFIGGMQNKAWKTLRLKLNPAFSSSKAKQVFNSISLCADELTANMHDSLSKKEEVTAKQLSFLFSHKVIASTFFGFECNSSASAALTTMINKTFLKTNILDFIFICCFYIPKLGSFIHYIPCANEVLKFYKNLSSAAVQARKQSQEKRNDVLQVLLDLKAEDDYMILAENDFENQLPMNKRARASNTSMTSECLKNTSKDESSLSDGCIAAQLFTFMSIGLNTLSNSMAVLLVDLASKPLIQNKVQSEIDETLKKHKEIDFNFLQQLKYLDAVIQESMRITPGFVGPTRCSSSPFKLPGTDLILEAGTTVFIPTPAIHLDPQHYPDPECFIPERFLDNNFKQSSTYLPFGAGPRMCLVPRLVVLMLKVAVTKVLLKYTLRMSPKARLPLSYTPTLMAKLKDELWLEFEPRLSSSI